MNTIEINEYFKHCPNYKGTYARDQIKPRLSKCTGIIINTDKCEEPGEHWVAIYLGADGIAIYFDSFGLPPLHQEIQDYINYISPLGYYHNTVTLQSIYQDTCGMYCIYFLTFMFTYKDYRRFLQIFCNHPHVNDVLAKLLYKFSSSLI